MTYLVVVEWRDTSNYPSLRDKTSLLMVGTAMIKRQLGTKRTPATTATWPCSSLSEHKVYLLFQKSAHVARGQILNSI